MASDAGINVEYIPSGITVLPKWWKKIEEENVPDWQNTDTGNEAVERTHTYLHTYIPIYPQLLQNVPTPSLLHTNLQIT